MSGNDLNCDRVGYKKRKEERQGEKAKARKVEAEKLVLEEKEKAVSAAKELLKEVAKDGKGTKKEGSEKAK